MMLHSPRPGYGEFAFIADPRGEQTRPDWDRPTETRAQLGASLHVQQVLCATSDLSSLGAGYDRSSPPLGDPPQMSELRLAD